MSQLPPNPGQHIPYAHPIGNQKTDVVSIIALVAGILGVFLPLVNIAAIILGAIGMSRTSKQGVGGKGLAISGLVLGIVGFLFSCVMLSIMLPALNRVRETANRAKCASNMSMIGKAAILHGIENRNNMPPDLTTLFKNGDLTDEAMCCPSSTATPGMSSASSDAQSRQSGYLSYVWVGSGLTTNAPSETPLLIEPLSNHDGDGGNVLFCDGHVEFVRAMDVQTLVNNAQSSGKIDNATALMVLKKR